jgi:hypothetical protein
VVKLEDVMLAVQGVKEDTKVIRTRQEVLIENDADKETRLRSLESLGLPGVPKRVTKLERGYWKMVGGGLAIIALVNLPWAIPILVKMLGD